MKFLNFLNSAVWGAPTLFIIFFTGLLLSLRTDFFQIRHLKKALFSIFAPKKSKSAHAMTPLQSASAALSATMGTGNIVGVAGAISLGGAGAVFWMWVSALFSMIVKFSEIVLAVRYRESLPDGSMCGGAMYYIKKALPYYLHFLSPIFAFCGMAAAFGIGNLAQINTLTGSVLSLCKEISPIVARSEFYIKLTVGAVCAALCAYVFKNDGRIGAFCEKIVPVMTVLYIFLTVGSILINLKSVPSVFKSIIEGAFSPAAVTGGAVGSVFTVMRFGMARGVFSNEAGLGTAPIAYACSDGDEITLGFFGIFEVFVDTVVVCTLTALTILCVGDVTYGADMSATLTLSSLVSVYGRGVIFVFCPIVCFLAFSSIIGWGLYGIKFASFLFGSKGKMVFLLLFCTACVVGAVFRADAVWTLSELLNGLMVLPNITALLMLSGKVAQITQKYDRQKKKD